MWALKSPFLTQGGPRGTWRTTYWERLDKGNTRRNTKYKNTEYIFKNNTHTSTKTMKKTNNPGILFNHLEGALGKRNAAAHWELQIFDLYKEVQFKIKSSAVAERTIYQKRAQ